MTTVTHIPETAEAGETTELNFSVAFDYAALAPLNQQYGAHETVTWQAVLGSDVTGVVGVGPASGSATLSASGPIVDISVAPNAVIGDTFSITATETLTELGINTVDDFSFDYTIITGPNSASLTGIPDVPTNAQMEQTSAGVIQSGDYKTISPTNWEIDNRVPGSGDDPSYYSGTSYSSMITAATNTVVQGVATRVSNALQSLGQTAANVATDFTSLSHTPLITNFRNYLNTILNNTMGALNTIAVSDLTDPTDSQMLQDGRQMAAQVGPATVTFLDDEQQAFQDNGQTGAANQVQADRTVTQEALNGTEDMEVGNSVSVSYVDPGTVINAGTVAGVINSGAGTNTIILHGGQDYVYTNSGNDTIDMSRTGAPDFIYGGGDGDNNKVVYTAPKSNYSLSFTSSTSGSYWTVTDLSHQAGDDFLFNIHEIKFSDQTVALTAKNDFKGAGKSDILWSNTNGDTAIWYANGSGGFTSTD